LYTVCFANSTNKDIPDPRAKSWEHVYQLVKDWAAKREDK
jgi:protein-tyrosine-phosphatase